MELLIFLLVIGGVIFHFANKWSEAVKPEPARAVTPVESEPEPNFYFRPSPEIYKDMAAFVFVGKADGQLREPECQLIIAYLRLKQPEHADVPDWYLLEKIREITPLSSSEYRSFIESRQANQLIEINNWFRQIIGTQKTMHPFEEYLLADLQDKIKVYPSAS